MRSRAEVKNKKANERIVFSRKEELNSREIEFLSKNTVPGLLAAKQLRKRVIKYSGSGDQRLKRFLCKPITQRDFLLIMAQTTQLFREVKRHNLLPKNVYLDLNHIYINETTKELSFVYLPFSSGFMGADYLAFMVGIISETTIVDAQNGACVSEFAFLIRSMDSFDTDKINAFIRKHDRSVADMVFNNTGAYHRELRDKEYYEQSDESNSNSDTDDEDVLNSISWNYEEDTGILGGGNSESLFGEDGDEDEGTTNLSSTADSAGDKCRILPDVGFRPTLTRVLTGEKYIIDKPVYRIGKEKSYVDLFIANNGAVSRNHADVIKRGTRAFIKDLNSKNGTYVDGKLIQPELEVELFDGSMIKLANEEFRFSSR